MSATTAMRAATAAIAARNQSKANKLSTLLNALQQCQPLCHNTGGRPSTMSQKPKTVLIVDDDEGMRDTLTALDTGDFSNRTGELTATALTGEGMGAAGIAYSNVENLVVRLGDGADHFYVDSTPVGTIMPVKATWSSWAQNDVGQR